MLTPKQLQNMPVYLVELYTELSDFVLSDIARRISVGAAITDTAEYQLYRASALQLSAKEITDKVAEINSTAADEVEKLMLSAARKSDEFERKVLKAENRTDTEQLQRLCEAEVKNTNGLCRNFTGSLGFATRNADGKVVYTSATDFLQKQMDMAQLKVASGTADAYTAVKQACNALSNSGLRTVYYESGHSDRIEVAVRRAVMTSLSQVTLVISEQNAEEFGADGWEISAHSGARPSHAIYQGRQYAARDFERIVRPLIDDYNCRHSAFPVILGVSEPVYTEEQLKALDPPPFVYEGRRYTAYEAQQQMRKMERAMRKQKDRCVVADASGDKDGFTAASIKLRRQKDIYKEFCEAAGSYTEYERTFVTQYDRHLSGKTGAVTRKQRAFERAQIKLDDIAGGKKLDKSGGSGIIKTGNTKPTIADDQHNGVSKIWDKLKSFFGKSDRNSTVTDEEVETALKDVGFKKVELSFFEKVDKPLQLSITDQLKILEDRFGAIKGSAYPRISSESIRGVACVQHDIVKTADQRLILSNKYFKGRKSHISARKRDVNSFYCMPCNIDDETLSRYVVTHEYGHMLEGVLIQKDLVGRFGTPKEKAVYYQKQILAIAKQIDTNFDIEKHLSKYGHVNEKEFFAECFANSQLGKPNVLGLAMQKWLSDRGF